MKAQDLKNSILQMAMEGKLVPQDHNDEPASVLLERIREEKEQLIKEKKIKRNNKESFIFRKNKQNDFYEKIGKKEPICINDEIPFEIPDSWEWVRLNYISQLNGGFAFKSSEFKEEGIRVIRISDFDENGFKNDKIVYYDENPELDKYCLENNDILMAMTGGTVGKTFFVNNLNEKMYVNQRVATIRIINAVNKNYIYSILESNYIKNIIHKNKNSTNDNISMNTISSFLIPLPPLNEQEKIVKKLDYLNLYVEDYNDLEFSLEELNHSFPKKIKDSILQDAIQGKLVLQDSDDEPASVLLERIKEEKEHLIKVKKIKRNKKESLIFKENNQFYEKIGNKEPFCIDDETPFEIPNNWVWCRLENLSENIHYGYTASAEEVGKVKLLRITDIHENIVNWDDVPFCSISEEKFIKYNLKNRDIVMARTGGTIGKSYIIDNLTEKAVFASYLIRIIPLENVYEKYLKLFFETPFFWIQLKDNTKGTGQPNVNATSLKNLLIPLPPYNEQKRIVNFFNEFLKSFNLFYKM